MYIWIPKGKKKGNETVRQRLCHRLIQLINKRKKKRRRKGEQKKGRKKKKEVFSYQKEKKLSLLKPPSLST